MNKKIYGATNDHVFKKIFGDIRHKTAIKGFLSDILDLPQDEYDVIKIQNPFLNIEDRAKDKVGILDVKLKLKSGKMVDIEMQVLYKPNMPERVLYYTSKMYLEQIGSGENYERIQKVVCIIIASKHILIKENNLRHNKFLICNPKVGTVFTDKMEINTLDLMKSPKNEENPELQKWVDLFNADTEEELKVVEKSPSAAVQEAVSVVEKINQDEQERAIAEQHDNARMEYQNDMHGYEKIGIEKGEKIGIEKGERIGIEKGKIETARSFLRMGVSIEQIAQGTGLSVEEIEKLK